MAYRLSLKDIFTGVHVISNLNWFSANYLSVEGKKDGWDMLRTQILYLQSDVVNAEKIPPLLTLENRIRPTAPPHLRTLSLFMEGIRAAIHQTENA